VNLPCHRCFGLRRYHHCTGYRRCLTERNTTGLNDGQQSTIQIDLPSSRRHTSQSSRDRVGVNGGIGTSLGSDVAGAERDSESRLDKHLGGGDSSKGGIVDTGRGESID